MNLFDDKIQYQKKKLVKSVSTDQEEILLGIMQLYTPEGIQADVCYNIGSFYSGSIPKPEFKFDLTPLTPDTIKADCRNLPLPDCSLRSVMFDPPFVCGTHINSEKYIMAEKYSSFKSRKEMQQMYIDSLKELNRVLKPKGYLIIKTQDVVSGRRKLFSSQLMKDECRRLGFKLIDEFILIAKNRFVGNIQTQFHSRSFHSFFIVFKKSK